MSTALDVVSPLSSAMSVLRGIPLCAPRIPACWHSVINSVMFVCEKSFLSTLGSNGVTIVLLLCQTYSVFRDLN